MRKFHLWNRILFASTGFLVIASLRAELFINLSPGYGKL